MSRKICVLPKVYGIGGMVSFLHKFSEGAALKGIEVTHDPNDPACEAMLVIGGTRDIRSILAFRRAGKKVVQRLDGLNWIHRVKPISFKHSLRAEYGNLVLSSIRRFLADEIVYQSEFSEWWWNKRFGEVGKPSSVVYNGVDLSTYHPGEKPNAIPSRIVVVEGSMGGGYEGGLENAILMTKGLFDKGNNVELQVVGEVEEELKNYWKAKVNFPILWTGKVRREDIPAIDRSARILFSADIHPACPNSVMEALACGLPVVSFDTGSLKELVSDDCGKVVDYGSNSWLMEKPKTDNLVLAAETILANWEDFSHNARIRAEQLFGLDQMVEKYLKVLLG